MTLDGGRRGQLGDLECWEAGGGVSVTPGGRLLACGCSASLTAVYHLMLHPSYGCCASLSVVCHLLQHLLFRCFAPMLLVCHQLLHPHTAVQPLDHSVCHQLQRPSTGTLPIVLLSASLFLLCSPLHVRTPNLTCLVHLLSRCSCCYTLTHGCLPLLFAVVLLLLLLHSCT